MAVAREKVASLVFLDFEATGLIGNGKKPRITELCLMSVQREELMEKYQSPRVVNKLTMCLNPLRMIDPVASEITGLYNDALESQTEFSTDVVKLIDSFLLRLPHPVCLLAHNGNGFDFRLLNAELKRTNTSLSGGILCADSLIGLRELDDNGNSISDSKPSNINLCNDTTPVGQSMPSIPEQVVDVKGRVRQIKRKCDPDFDRVPIQAKSVRKRLFDSGDKIRDSSFEPKLNLIGTKHIGSSSKMPADVVSKRNTCDIESVKKKLSFDAVDDDDDDDDLVDNSVDVEMSDAKDIQHSSVVNSSMVSSMKPLPSRGMKNGQTNNLHSDSPSLLCTENVNSRFPKSSELLLESQQSVPDEDFLEAVGKIEATLPNFTNISKPIDGTATLIQDTMPSIDQVTSSETDFGMSPCSNLRPSAAECVTPKSDKTTVSQVSGMYTPDTPGSHPHGAIVNENCLTPMTGLLRSTAACQLNTPAKNPVEQQHKNISSSACRVLFRGDSSYTGNDNNVLESTANHKHHSALPFSSIFTKSGVETHLTASSNGQLRSSPAVVPSSTDGSIYKTDAQQITPVTQFKPKQSYKLSEIYKRTFGRDPHNTHTAESDCLTLMAIVKQRSPEFIQWVDEHAIPLSSFEPAY